MGSPFLFVRLVNTSEFPSPLAASAARFAAPAPPPLDDDEFRHATVEFKPLNKHELWNLKASNSRDIQIQRA